MTLLRVPMWNGPMWSRRLLALVIALGVSLLSFDVMADAALYFKFKTPATCETQGGSTVNVPVGRFLPEPLWLKLDNEWREIQDSNTRLLAENKYMREQDASPGWKMLAGAAALGVLVGTYIIKE